MNFTAKIAQNVLPKQILKKITNLEEIESLYVSQTQDGAGLIEIEMNGTVTVWEWVALETPTKDREGREITHAWQVVEIEPVCQD